MHYIEADFIIEAPQNLMRDARDIVAALAGEAGFETFEDTPEGLRGYVQAQLFSPEALAGALEAFPIEGVSVRTATREAEHRDWNEAWEREGFEPIVIEGGCIVYDGRHIPSQQAETMVEIDARQAFGTGTHATTRLMLSALLDMDLRGQTVLDCGCGTAILAIAALKRGAAFALAYDIDEWSADNARHNAELNGVAPRLDIRLGDAGLLANLDQRFTLALANINRNTLLADLPAIAQRLLPGAAIALSGFYESDISAIASALNSQGFAEPIANVCAPWACLVARKQ